MSGNVIYTKTIFVVKLIFIQTNKKSGAQKKGCQHPNYKAYIYLYWLYIKT